MSNSFILIAILFTLLITILITYILHYHWREYAYNPAAIATAKTIYYVGIGVLLLIALGSAAVYLIL